MRANRMQIVLLNHASKLFPDAQLVRVMQACQKQQVDFGRAWGMDAMIGLVRAGSRQPANLKAAWVVLCEDEAQAKALGIGDLTPAGLPCECVLVSPLLSDKDSISAAVSRSVLAILSNPSCNDYSHDPSSDSAVPREVCDPVALDEAGYKVGGVLVTDFVYPAWFQPGAAGPYDQMRRCKAPFQALDGTQHGLRAEKLERASHGELVKSDPKSSAAISLPGAPPRAQPVRRPPPPARPTVQPVSRPVLRQPDRGANSVLPRDRVVLRQPLRGFRAEAAQAPVTAQPAAPASPAPSVSASANLAASAVSASPVAKPSAPVLPK